MEETEHETEKGMSGGRDDHRLPSGRMRQSGNRYPAGKKDGGRIRPKGRRTGNFKAHPGG